MANRKVDNIMCIPKIKFGKKIYCEDEGDATLVYSYGNVASPDFDDYMSALENAGFKVLKRNISSCKNISVDFARDNDAVYAMYYPSVCEMRVVYEPDS